MSEIVKYKRPRKINVVSVSLTLILIFLGYMASQYVPIWILRSEANRVLDEHTSKFSGAKNRYLQVEKDRKRLKAEMSTELRRVGINDPDMEVWLEVESQTEVLFGVLYSEYVNYPFELMPRKEIVEEIEYVLKLTKPRKKL